MWSKITNHDRIIGQVSKYLLFVFFLLSGHMTWSQIRLDDEEEGRKEAGIGGEVKGMYIGGISIMVPTAGLTLLGSAISDSRERKGLPVITAGISAAPSSLMGLGIGALLARKHSPIDQPFQLGIGVTFSPLFLGTVTYEKLSAVYDPGVMIQLLSPEIGRWRYRLSGSYFRSKEYQLVDRITRRSRWEINMDLQYLIISNRHWKLYPFIGTYYIYATRTDLPYPFGSTSHMLAANLGAGVNYSITTKWNVFAEIKMTADDDRDYAIYSFGISFLLGK